MAKKQYENKVENLTAAFIKESKEKENKKSVQEVKTPPVQEPSGVKKQNVKVKQTKEQTPKSNPEPVKEPVKEPFKPKEPDVVVNEAQTPGGSVTVQQDVPKGSGFNRYTFYITVEEKAALDQISIDEDMGKSEILREVLDAGLEAVSPGIFERTKEKADELRNRVKVPKNKNERKIYERLKQSLS